MAVRGLCYFPLFFLAGSILGGSAAASYELRTLYRDTRMKAMGGAGIALHLDDRDAIQGVFTNPAQMAGNQGITLHYLGVDLGASYDTYSAVSDVSSAFSNFTFDSLNALMGKNVYGNAQLVAGITAPNVGAAIIMDGQTAFYGQNQAYPEFTVAYQTTTGVQAAWGTVIDLSSSGPGGGSSSRRRPRKQRGARGESESGAVVGGGSGGSELRFGLGGKMLWRRGGYKDVPLTTLLSANIDTLKALMGSFEAGYGLDAGAQFIRSVNSNWTYALAASYTNIGDVNFRKDVADTIPGNLTAGGMVQYSLGGLTSWTLAYDQAFLLTPTDWRKRNHLGLEWALPGISVFGGINQTYLSYGASFDAWIFRMTAASYAEELGGAAYQEGNRRYLLRLAMRLSL